MGKVIKLKQSDVENIVANIISESEMDNSSDLKEIDNEVELTLGIDDEGNYYVMKNGKTDNPDILYTTN